MNSGTISREVSLVSREVTELSLPESLRDSPAGKSKILIPDNKKSLVRERSSDKLKPSPDVRKLLGTEKSEDKLKLSQSHQQERAL